MPYSIKVFKSELLQITTTIYREPECVEIHIRDEICKDFFQLFRKAVEQGNTQTGWFSPKKMLTIINDLYTPSRVLSPMGLRVSDQLSNSGLPFFEFQEMLDTLKTMVNYAYNVMGTITYEEISDVVDSDDDSQSDD